MRLLFKYTTSKQYICNKLKYYTLNVFHVNSNIWKIIGNAKEKFKSYVEIMCFNLLSLKWIFLQSRYFKIFGDIKLTRWYFIKKIKNNTNKHRNLSVYEKGYMSLKESK